MLPPRLDPEVYDIHDAFMLVPDLLLQEKIPITQGTGFNWPTLRSPGIVTALGPRPASALLERLGNFLRCRC